jgi:hypothetical protein
MRLEGRRFDSKKERRNYKLRCILTLRDERDANTVIESDAL